MTVYLVIVDPPSLAGMVHVTWAWPFPAVAVTPVGAPGTPGGVLGVTEFDGFDGGESPIALAAVTVNV